MAKNPNPNLWSVGFKTKWMPYGTERLWICATSASRAEAKAKRHLQKQGETQIRITRVSHEGTIDVF